MKLEEVREIIENEGFCYAFVNYSDFDEIEDEKFHELRNKFIEAYENLDEYIPELDDEAEEK